MSPRALPDPANEPTISVPRAAKVAGVGVRTAYDACARGEWPSILFVALPPVERARRIANSLLALLPAAERDTWTERAHALGETWLGAHLVTYTDDQAITTRQAAALLCVSEAVIRRWACQPHPTLPGRPLLPRAGRRGRQQTYLVRCLLDASATVRRRPQQPDQGVGAAQQHQPHQQR